MKNSLPVKVDRIHKRFGQFVALGDISLEIPAGQLVALLGPSGSGKTTLLRIIAGLESPDVGKVYFGDKEVTDQSPKNRKVGFVFQHYALFRHMSVFENIAFGLNVRKASERPSYDEIRARVLKLLDLVQLSGLERRFPSQLSGGQRQRVALARALAVEPSVLLLDEPFGALDAKVRKELRRWLRLFHDEMGITTVFVTHDQEEALEIADNIVLMDHGKIEQVGTPQQVYDRPASAFVYQFLGNVNTLNADVRDKKVQIGELALPLPSGWHEDGRDGKALAFIRPHDVEIAATDAREKALNVTVRHVNFAGPVTRLQLQRHDTREFLDAEITRALDATLQLRPGTEIRVRFRDVQVYPAPADGGSTY